jgi:phosphatidylglycerol lysyltransferase
MLQRFRRVMPVVLGLAIFLTALEVLRLELRAVSWHDLTADIRATPPHRLALAMALTALNYVALAGYDLLAFVYVGSPVSRARIASASFVAYAISNSVGFAVLSGASVRYRFYSRWGVAADDLARIVVCCSVTFWLGLFALGGAGLVLSPLPAAAVPAARTTLIGVGWVLTAIPAAYLIATVVRKATLRLRGFELPLPQLPLAAGQLLVSALDWALAGAVLYSLLPPSALTFVQFLGLFLVAILLGLLSHVPGGLGVFEGVMVLLLRPHVATAMLVPSLVVFRAVYYLLPLALGLVALILDEAWQHRQRLSRAGAVLGQWTERLTPPALAVATFVAGVVLLSSGATPAAPGRLAILHAVLPLGVIEASHFAGSVAGAVLLVMSPKLARRLDAAFFLAAGTIAVGVVAALLKGFDYEEAVLLLALLLLFWRARPVFDRRAAFFDAPFSGSWIAAVVGALAASIWLGLFAFQHVEYSNDLWWQFALEGEASRFMRGSVGAAVVLLLFAIARLIGFARHRTPLPTDADLEDVSRVIAAQTHTLPFLAFLRDKALLFNDERSAFIMYGVQGQTWVALGDPVGPAEHVRSLIGRFLERCADFGGVPVFYEIGREHLADYADFGLTFAKVGEEALVDLPSFTLDGGHASRHRQALRRLEKDGYTFRVVPAGEVASILTQLRAVSDDWLASRVSAEKGFSLGFFDDTYIVRCPVGVIERDGRIVAFANVLAGARHDELSVDLMRYHRKAPKSVMEGLLVHLMIWGRSQGYRRFALGMAPLSGFEASPASSLWNRFGRFLYEHADTIYDFQGLRAFKEKFDPAWEPHYLAYQGGVRLPRLMVDVSALVAGGYRQIFRK